MSATNFGHELRRQRLQLGLNLPYVADAIGVTVPYLNDVECGNREPMNEDRIRALAMEAGFDEALLLRATGEVPDDVRKAMLEDRDMIDAIRYAVRKGIKGDEMQALMMERVHEAEMRPIVERHEAALAEAKRLLGEASE